MEIDMSQLAQLARDLEEDPKRVLTGARRLVVGNSRLIAESMKRRIPLGPGNYGIHTRDSVTADSRPHSDHGNPFAEAGPTHFVGRFLEYGTVKMAPQPFADASTDENLAGIENDFANLLGDF